MIEDIPPATRENESGPENVDDPFRRLRKLYLVPVLHVFWCTLLVLCMVYLLDGYHAVPPDSPRYIDGQLRLRVSDVTTIISLALVITKLFVGAWTGLILWNIVFVLLETPGMKLSKIDQTMSYYLPPWRAVYRQKAGAFVIVLLLLVVPQQFISPLLSGAVDWDVGSEYNPTLAQTQAGYPGVDPLFWFWYYFSSETRRAYVRRAAAFASIVWDGAASDRGHCRHLVNDDGFPVNSTVLDAVVPCIQIHSITFPSTPPPADLARIVHGSVHASDRVDKLTRVRDAPFRYSIDGNAVLFDLEDRPGPFDEFPPEEEGGFRREVPSPYIQTGLMHAVVMVNGTVPLNGNNCTDLTENIFGMTRFNNIFTPVREGNYYRCFTYAVVNLTAGVAVSPSSRYISPRVVEADLRDADMDLQPGPWVQEAMYLMPDVMSMFSMMNSSSLPTWGRLEEYVNRLIRYSYQGAWDMLSRSFEPNQELLPVRLYEQRQVAQVSRPRVFGWLGASLAMTISCVLLVLGGHFSTRSIVLEGPVSAFVTDSSPLLARMGLDRDITNASSPSSAVDRELGAVVLRKTRGGRYSLTPATAD